ncbi:uncharacterized protein PG998_011015 [Apiospora kogelbergensis]|uniref:Uncharacterized protein n=1 Tax=Apiospora kogelbergensis TaxID=1337665 RepID=A0AAW0RD85_9PEZI
MAVTVGNNEARPTERADPEPKQSISHRSAQKTRPLPAREDKPGRQCIARIDTLQNPASIKS